MKRSLTERLGLEDVYPKPPKAQADATAVKRKAPVDTAANEREARAAMKPITADEIASRKMGK